MSTSADTPQAASAEAFTVVPDLPLTDAERYALATWGLVTFVLGGLGNMLVVVAMILHRFKIDSTSRWLIASIAILDILYIVGAVTTSVVSNFAEAWLFGSFLCEATSNFVNWFTAVHMIIVMILSLNKWLRCRFPLRSLYQTLTTRSGIIVTVVVWTISTVPTLEYYLLDRGAYFDVSINR